MSGPETSERHHGPFPAGRVPLSPARMLCPRGESPLTYIPTIIGELVLGGHQHTSRPRRGRALDVQREAWQWALNR